MAKIFPFRALRYDPGRVPLPQVVTQPYDKITPAMQAGYYQASPYNLVRIILGTRDPSDSDGNNVYTRAARDFSEWRRQGILRQDGQPSLYAYSQEFTPPGEAGGRRYERRGFIALGQIEDYSASVVFRHEQTLSKPKADRLELLRATRAHFGQIFMLYNDPSGRLEVTLFPPREPEITIADEYGVVHKVWPISDPRTIENVSRGMADQKLIIADGHHRYETALNYRNERRAGAASPDPEAPYERVMMTLINAHSPGMLILPTHRLVFGLPNFEPGPMVAASRFFYGVREVSRDFDSAKPLALLPHTSPGETAMLAVTAKQAFLFQANPGTRHSALNSVSPRQAELDVVRLHKVVLESVLNISEEAIRDQRNLEYLRDAAEAVQRVRSGGADVAFLLNAVPVEQMTEIALAGEVMPQKSTDFYPKLLSGLAIYALD
ncbi:MAG TPA: DUF1015 domain-containing protein [Terriglobales bacterium]|nr:DUF1015 domain-containing protein [Terriglobales bacterium]